MAGTFRWKILKITVHVPHSQNIQQTSSNKYFQDFAKIAPNKHLHVASEIKTDKSCRWWTNAGNYLERGPIISLFRWL